MIENAFLFRAGPENALDEFDLAPPIRSLEFSHANFLRP